MDFQSLLNNNATIIVAVLGAVVSVFTLVLGKRYETKIELRKIKEEQYISFLSNIAKMKVKEGTTKENELLELSMKIQTIYLVGNKGVQKALQNYLNMLVAGSKDPQEELYGKLIQAMKVDLYGRKYFILPKRFSSLDKVPLVVFDVDDKIS